MMHTHTVQEVAKILNISAATVYALCAKKKIAHIRVGAGRGSIRICEEDLSAFVAAVTVQPEAPAPPRPPLTALQHIKL